MTKLTTLLISTLSFLIISCGSRDAKKIELEVMFFNKSVTTATNYPKEFQSLCLPLKDICKPKMDIGFSPLYLRRIDLGKRFEIDYQKNKAVNYSKIKAIERNLTSYFKDSIINPVLLEETNTAFSISDFITNNGKKENYFVFSTDENFTAGSIPVYRGVDELRSAIEKSICEKSLTKVVVLFEPTSDKIQPPPVTGDTLPKLDSTSTFDSALKNILLGIANPNLPFSERKSKAADVIAKMFTNNFSVVMHADKATGTMTVWERGEGKNYFLERITTDDSILGFDVLRVERSINNGKISHLEIVEIHRKD